MDNQERNSSSGGVSVCHEAKEGGFDTNWAGEGEHCAETVLAYTHSLMSYIPASSSFFIPNSRSCPSFVSCPSRLMDWFDVIE